MRKRILLSHHHEEYNGDVTRDQPGINMPNYTFHAFYKAGYLPMILPPIPLNEEIGEQYIQSIDILALMDGYDICPSKYGEELSHRNVQRYTFRDENELLLLKLAIRHKKVVIGICRGIQLINVFFGGTLYQHLESQLTSSNNKLLHRQRKEDIRQLSHQVMLQNKGYLYQLLKCDRIWVNSYHEQGIKELGDALQIEAISHDGLIEAIKHKDFPIYGFQWHPDMSYEFDDYSRKILQYFATLNGFECC